MRPARKARRRPGRHRAVRHPKYRIMKKLLALVIVAVTATSCYSTRLIVGDVSPTEPLVEVNRVWNSHMIFGLVPLDATMYTDEYARGYDNYVVKTYTSFLNGFIGVFTWGLYTPTETVYYIPLNELQYRGASYRTPQADDEDYADDDIDIII